MGSMKVDWLIILVLLATNLNLVLSLREISPAEEMELEKQLKLINKPAIKSFKTEYGDILDCIAIDKQLAFDHPLLKNHSIQMRPSSNIRRPERSPSRFKASQFLPNNIRCPKGTVVTKRAEKEDLLMAKFTPLQFTNFALFSGHDQQQEAKPAAGHQVARLSMQAINAGISGTLNVWDLQLAANQFSSVDIFVSSVDGSVVNGIAAGWFVHTSLYKNGTRLFIFWTKDSAQNTGCFNTFCPGFVQVSRKFPTGVVLYPLSTYGGDQREITVRVVQDDVTGNWWLRLGDDNIGYYPKELFTTLANGATAGGWGAEIYSSIVDAYPPMGSGRFPEEGYTKACFIRQMEMLDPSHSVIYPDKNSLQEYVSLPKCYRVSNLGGQIMFVGGPPDCTWKH